MEKIYITIVHDYTDSLTLVIQACLNIINLV